MTYSDKAIEYFLEAAHAGKMDNPDGVGVIGDLECGDHFVIYIKVTDNHISEVSYQVFGCPAAIATCEAAAVIATGLSIEEARRITDDDIFAFLERLPKRKEHCSHSAAEALQAAIFHYSIESEKQKSIELEE